MKRIVLYSALLLLLTLTAGPLRADVRGNEDTVTLKDGRVLKGQVVEESSSSVVMLLGGMQRSFSRDFIAKIGYGKGPDERGAAPAPEAGVGVLEGPGGADAGASGYPDGPSDEAAQAVPARPRPSLVAVLSRRYRVPVGDVLWVRRQGVPDTDLPLVFWVAASARVTPRAVVKLYRQGWSWGDIEAYFHIQRQDEGYDAQDAVPAPDDGAVYDPGYDYGPYDWDAWYGDGWGWDLGYGVGYGGAWYGGGGRGGWGRGGAWNRGGNGGWGHGHNGGPGAGGRTYVGGGHVGASVSGGGHVSSGGASGGHGGSGGGRH